ncbi:MAG TPA: cytochrome C, partial [bacterium]|nr:cytochrome C [bacterium]
ICANFLHEQQNLNASFPSKATNATDYLDQFRMTASYYWNAMYGFTVGFVDTFGSADAKRYPVAPITGSAAGLPDSQALIVQFDWTPWGNDNTHAEFPWLNVRVGLQYTHYLEFNGGTTNYDGSGRNASDNDSYVLFTWFSF